nr:uncharacterized protein LOC124497226 isoform X2 [Dermatophagoides farinae]
MKLEFIPISNILVFAAIILHICCGNDAQNIKSHSIVDNNRYDGPSSPVFFHRQRAMASFQVSDQPSNQQPEFGYRLRMPSQANPKTYMDYNQNTNVDLMSVKPRPIIINRGEQQLPLDSSPSSSEQIRPSEYSRHYDEQQREQPEPLEQSTFTGSNDNNFYGVPQPSSSSSSSSGNVSQPHESELHSTPNPVPTTEPGIVYYDFNDENQQQVQKQQIPLPQTTTSRSSSGEHSDQRQIEWIRYIQRFQPITNPIFTSVPQQQIIPASQIPVGTPVIFHPNGPQPVPEAGRPGGVGRNQFVQIPRPGGPLQSQHLNVPINQFQQVEIPQQRVAVVPANVATPQQPSLVIIPQQQQRYFRFQLPRQQDVADTSYVREIRPMPMNFPITQIHYLQPTIPELIRIGSTGNTAQQPTNVVGYKSVSEPVNQTAVGYNYQVTQEKPVVTQTRIHTPVFVTDFKPSKGFKYTVTRDDQPTVEQQQHHHGEQSMVSIPVAQQPIDSRPAAAGGGDRFYQVPIPTAQPSAQPIRHFYVPPYMHPFPIDNIMRPPMYYSNENSLSDYKRASPGETHTLPVVSNQPAQGGPVTITIEPIPQETPSTGSRSSQPIVSEPAPAQSTVIQSKPINLVIDKKNKNSGQPLRQAVFEPIKNVAYLSDYPEFDSHGQPKQQQPITQIGHSLRQPNTYEPPNEYQNQIGQPLRQTGQKYGHSPQHASDSFVSSGQPLSETDNYLPIYGPPSIQNYQHQQSSAIVDESSELEPGHPDYITGRGHQLNSIHNPQQYLYAPSLPQQQQQSSVNTQWPVQQKIDNNREYYQQSIDDGHHQYHHQTSSKK